MGKIYVLYGMSNAGKSTVEKVLLKRGSFNQVISDTTRPMRGNEIDGIDYNFVSKEKFLDGVLNGEFVEYREYKTKLGIWYYGIRKSAIDLSKGDYVCVVELDGMNQLIEKFGKENVVPIYLFLTDYWELLKRAIDRQPHANKTQCQEMCRRFLSDIEDFEGKAEKLTVLKINNVNTNDTVDIIIRNIKNNSI